MKLSTTRAVIRLCFFLYSCRSDELISVVKQDFAKQIFCHVSTAIETNNFTKNYFQLKLMKSKSLAFLPTRSIRISRVLYRVTLNCHIISICVVFSLVSSLSLRLSCHVFFFFFVIVSNPITTLFTKIIFSCTEKNSLFQCAVKQHECICK